MHRQDLLSVMSRYVNINKISKKFAKKKKKKNAEKKEDNVKRKND